MSEEIKLIPSCPGYGATADGRIWSFKVGRFRRVHRIKNGYVTVTVQLLGKRNASRYVHRMVAEAWVPNPQGLPDVDHIDGSRDGNRADNLRWATRSQNLLYAKARGVKIGAPCRLSSSQVRAIIRDARPQKHIARQYGIDPSYVSQLKSRVRRISG